MKNRNIRLILLPVLFSASFAWAERADRQKPVNIEADRVTVDDVKKVHVFEGHVTLTQGTTMIRGDRVVVTQDAEGFQKGVSTGNLAYFRTKRDGRDEYVEGEAERIEHDDRNELTHFYNRAHVKSGEDEVRGQYIQYDGRTEQYVVTSGPQGTTAARGQPRVRAVIQPKTKEGAKAQPGARAAEAPALKPSNTIEKPQE